MRDSLGYSLVELAVVVALLATGVVMAAPSFTALLESERVTAASNRLVVEIQQARLGAVSSGHRVVICGSADGQNCNGSSEWSAGTPRVEDADRDFTPRPGEGVTGVRPAIDRNGLRLATTPCRRNRGINRRRLTSGANQTLHVCSLRGPEWRRIIINMAGRPRTSRPETGRICPP